ncbi:hypothetical protein ACP4OV_007181 [Aristida adscensionis]
MVAGTVRNAIRSHKPSSVLLVPRVDVYFRRRLCCPVVPVRRASHGLGTGARLVLIGGLTYPVVDCFPSRRNPVNPVLPKASRTQCTDGTARGAHGKATETATYMLEESSSRMTGHATENPNPSVSCISCNITSTIFCNITSTIFEDTYPLREPWSRLRHLHLIRGLSDLLVALHDMDGIAPAPAVVPPAPGWTLSNAGASGLTAASLVLLFLYLTCRFLWLYNKEAAAAAAALPPRGAAAVPVSALPVFVHVAPAAPAARGEEERAACAVCLAEFAAGDAGRLLPRCGHGFHEACIAAWLRVNTTCPLCHAAVLAPVAPAAK